MPQAYNTYSLFTVTYYLNHQEEKNMCNKCKGNYYITTPIY